jgi:hypothetical protein
VAVPTPDEIVMELPVAILPLPTLMVTAPPLVLPSPEARAKLLPLLVDDDPEVNRSPDMPAVHALLINMTTLPKLVAVPTPNKIVM